MKIRGLMDEDVVNYKKCSMYIAFPSCTFKCEKEYGEKICQNSSLANAPLIDIKIEDICKRYVENPLTNAIVFGGLEPFNSPFDLISFIDCLRRHFECEDDIVIYTGYTEEELLEENSLLNLLYQNICKFKNIIIKFGRYIPNQEAHFDEVLGVNLASNNQYAKKVS